MSWLMRFEAVRRLRAEWPAYRQVMWPLILAYMLCLPWGTKLWLAYRTHSPGEPSAFYPLLHMLPEGYVGQNMVLLVYMLMLLGAARRSDGGGSAAPMQAGSTPTGRGAARQFWLQGFAWFVHTALICQIAMAACHAANPLLWGLGLVAFAEALVQSTVPAVLARERCELVDAVVLAHKNLTKPHAIMQVQLWVAVLVGTASWLSYVLLVVFLCMPTHAFLFYYARTLAIAAQMSAVVLLPLHAFASVRLTHQTLEAAQSGAPVPTEALATDVSVS